jgi:hypothetical protein
MSSRRRQCKEERAKGFPPVKKLAPAGRFVLSGICRHEHALRVHNTVTCLTTRYHCFCLFFSFLSNRLQYFEKLSD